MSTPLSPISSSRVSGLALALSLSVLSSVGLAQTSGPKAVMPELIHDFGTVVRADVAEKAFVIRNEGDEPLEIREVNTSCACTVVDFPRTIPPGEEREVLVKVDTDFVDGALQAQARLFTNDPNLPEIQLTLKITTQPYIYVHPGYVRYNTHQFEPREGLVRQLIWAEKPKEFRILEVESPRPFIDVTFGEVAVEDRNPIHDGPQWVVETRIREDAPVGPLAGWVRLVIDHEKQTKVSIPLSGFIRPLYAFTPGKLDLRELQPGEKPIRASVHFKNFAEKPIEITKVESDVEGLAFELEAIKEGHEYWVYVFIPSDMAKGPFSGVVKVYTTSEKQPVAQTTVTGTIL